MLPLSAYSSQVIGSLPLLFFKDDVAEETSGVVTGICTFDTRLGDADVAGLSRTGCTGQVSGTVPEPASWAMMVAGFGLVGAALRRRQVAVSFS